MHTRFEVVSARTVIQRNRQNKYVSYSIRIHKVGDDVDTNPVVIERRYTDFLKLYKDLKNIHPPLIAGVDFPRKAIIGNFAPEVIKRRSWSFENLLKVIAENEKLLGSSGLQYFLTNHEETEACKWLQSQRYSLARPLLENIFRLLSKIHTDRHPSVIIALCRLIACCNADITALDVAEKYAELALRRFEGISDVDLLYYYVPLLQLCVHLWWTLGRDKEAIEARLASLKRNGHRVESFTPLLDSMLWLN